MVKPRDLLDVVRDMGRWVGTAHEAPLSMLSMLEED
jgi:hypothetical protein